MGKNIIFCADGMWGLPDLADNQDNVPHHTNVYQLFELLSGVLTVEAEDEKERCLTEDGAVTQVAKYLHGVGDSQNTLVKIMSGVFGASIITPIVRGYTFISRVYEPGDNIFIVSFSHGAYTARTLAGFIVTQGLLERKWATNKDHAAYEKGCEAWYRYRETLHPRLGALAEIAPRLPGFFKAKTLADTDFTRVERVEAVAVWETVGMLGIPLSEGENEMDGFRFADTRLHNMVRCGFQAISLDEERIDLCPTLWDSREGVKQLLFLGDHADVGGGYPTTSGESKMSYWALRWIWGELNALGVRFTREPSLDLSYTLGKMHKPWRGGPFAKGMRSFPSGLLGHCTLPLRFELSGASTAPYSSNAPLCNGYSVGTCAFCSKSHELKQVQEELTLATIQCRIDYSKKTYQWFLQHRSESLLTLDQAHHYLWDCGDEWNTLFLSTFAPNIQSFLNLIDANETFLPKIKIYNSGPGSWSIEALLSIPVYIGAIFVVVEKISKLPKIVDDLNSLVQRLKLELQDMINKKAVKDLNQKVKKGQEPKLPDESITVEIVLNAEVLRHLSQGKTVTFAVSGSQAPEVQRQPLQE